MKKSLTKDFDVNKVYNDRAVNQGFPEGMTLKDFLPMALVEVQWDDAPNDMVLIAPVEKEPASYKGDRGFSGLRIMVDYPERDVERQLQCSPTHTQIVRLVSRGPETTELLLGRYEYNRGVVLG